MQGGAPGARGPQEDTRWKYGTNVLSPNWTFSPVLSLGTPKYGLLTHLQCNDSNFVFDAELALKKKLARLTPVQNGI